MLYVVSICEFDASSHEYDSGQDDATVGSHSNTDGILYDNAPYLQTEKRTLLRMVVSKIAKQNKLNIHLNNNCQ